MLILRDDFFNNYQTRIILCLMVSQKQKHNLPVMQDHSKGILPKNWKKKTN